MFYFVTQSYSFCFVRLCENVTPVSQNTTPPKKKHFLPVVKRTIAKFLYARRCAN
jgi:hypothetical protein